MLSPTQLQESTLYYDKDCCDEYPENEIDAKITCYSSQASSPSRMG